MNGERNFEGLRLFDTDTNAGFRKYGSCGKELRLGRLMIVMVLEVAGWK